VHRRTFRLYKQHFTPDGTDNRVKQGKALRQILEVPVLKSRLLFLVIIVAQFTLSFSHEQATFNSFFLS
jgi:hypothetical protein